MLIEGVADPVEAGAEPWATPQAWAEHDAVVATLQVHSEAVAKALRHRIVH